MIHPDPAELWSMPRFRNWIAVAKVHLMVEKALAARLQLLGLKLPHHDMLMNIWRTPGLTQHELAGKLLVGRSNLSMLLPELERRGLVERRADAGDRRVRRLHLTPEGEALTVRAIAVQKDVVDTLMGALSDEECHSLGEFMRRIAAHLQATGLR
jgi:MarR family transcriptional regulator, organic hydroperoxide resistance regulator